MAQCVKALAAKPDLTWIPGTHSVEGIISRKLSSDCHTCAETHACMFTNAHKPRNIIKHNFKCRKSMQLWKVVEVACLSCLVVVTQDASWLYPLSQQRTCLEV